MALLCVGPRPGHAHHVASDAGITQAQPRTILELIVDGGRLTAGDARASYLRTSPALELQVLSRLSVRAQASLVTIEPEGGETTTGPGDTELAAKVNLLSDPHGGWLLSTGLGVKLPTGDSDRGLGGGHVGVAPFVAGSWERERRGVTFVVAALVVDMIALTPDEHGGAERLSLAPHGPHEAVAVTTVALATRHAWAAVGTSTSFVFDPADGFDKVSARALTGVRFGPSFRLLASLEAPLAGDTGYRWRGMFGLAYVR